MPAVETRATVHSLSRFASVVKGITPACWRAAQAFICGIAFEKLILWPLLLLATPFVYTASALRRADNETFIYVFLTSATGVPTPFEILAEWQTGNVAAVERETHRRLKPYRVNKRREFFRLQLSAIITIVQEVIRMVNQPQP